MSSTRLQATPRNVRGIRAFQATSFAALLMLVIEFGFGIVVNLYTNIPASDQGKSMFAAFGAAVTTGPVALSVHAILGTLILITAIAAVVRAAQTRRVSSIVIAGIALLAVIAAWTSGTGFVGHQANGPSLSMALATAIAMICYALILFTSPSARPRR